jgi:RHS repeat-associated protein
MRYLNGPAVDEILARTNTSGTTSWYLRDQIGSVTDVVNASGSVIDHIVYDPYGNIVTETNATNGDRFKFAGMGYDSATGLYYDHARYYDAVTGKFMSQDPKSFSAGDTDLYRYVGNSPTSSTDPSGMDEWTALLTMEWILGGPKQNIGPRQFPTISGTFNYGPSSGIQPGTKITLWPISPNPFAPIVTIPKPPNPGSAPPNPIGGDSIDIELQEIIDYIMSSGRNP